MRHTSHDSVTGLPGRALIRDRLANPLQRSRRNGLSLVVLFVDLDGFNLVKDTDGHDVGDCLLNKVAERLTEQIRPGGYLGASCQGRVCHPLRADRTIGHAVRPGRSPQRQV